MLLLVSSLSSPLHELCSPLVPTTKSVHTLFFIDRDNGNHMAVMPVALTLVDLYPQPA